MEGSFEARLGGPADVWRPVIEEALEHGLRTIDGFKVDRKDKTGRAARRERGDRLDEVLDEIEAIREAHYEIHRGVGKLLPEEDVPELARLVGEVLAVTPGEGTADDLDTASALAELVSEAMLKRGGPKLPEGAATAGSSGSSGSRFAADPVAEDRQRAIERLEHAKAEAVASERYEEAGCASSAHLFRHFPSVFLTLASYRCSSSARCFPLSELKAQISAAKLLLVERKREMQDESER